MNAKTLKALKGSIKKWKKIEDNLGGDEGADNCELCKKFDDCTDCPVHLKVKDCGCCSTPYAEWCKHHCNSHNMWNPPFKIKCKECERLRIKELEFLKSLRK